MMHHCVMCGDLATKVCPRCQKPLCEQHGTQVVEGGLVVYRPGEDCKVPLGRGQDGHQSFGQPF
jgi:hypothetical protein